MRFDTFKESTLDHLLDYLPEEYGDARIKV